jgi:hypothetical protein
MDRLEEIHERLRLTDAMLAEFGDGESLCWIYAAEYTEDIPYLLAENQKLRDSIQEMHVNNGGFPESSSHLETLG